MQRISFFSIFLLFIAMSGSAYAATNAVSGLDSGSEMACARLLGFTGSALNDAARLIVVNKEACDAYRFLLERNGTGTRDTWCYKSQTDRILKLNPEFAVGLYKALSEIEKLHGGKNIVQSGFRCAGYTHGSGCAADIIWASCLTRYGGNIGSAWRCASDRFDAPEQKWIDANGKNAPYNIHLRLRFAPEGHHVEPVNTKGCSTGGVVGSDNAPPSNSSPTGLGDAFRQTTGLGQQPTLPPQSALPPQPLPQNQQPLQYFQPATPVGTTPSVTAEPGQPVGTPAPIASGSNVDAKTNTAAPIIKGGSRPRTDEEEFVSSSKNNSIADQLLILAYGTSSTSTSTEIGTGVDLVVSKKDSAKLKSSGKYASSTASTTSKFASTTSFHPSQTFISHDIVYSSSSKVGIESRTEILAFLADMRARLLRALEILRPFGLRGAPLKMEIDYDVEAEIE